MTTQPLSEVISEARAILTEMLRPPQPPETGTDEPVARCDDLPIEYTPYADWWWTNP